MRVAVVWDHDRTGVINRFGQPCWEEYGREAVENVAEALREGGHETLLCEGDKGLLATLERFMPPDPQAQPSGMVFNMALGIQGECRYAHVPAMLEMAGIPYTGSSPLGHGLALDKAITKRLMRDAGVPTPNFRVMRRGTAGTDDLRFPVVVKPRHETTSFGLQLVHEPAQLEQAIDAVVTQYAQDALVEEYIEGREITVALLGNGELEVLPLVEYDFGDREMRLVTWEVKHIAAESLRRICPAQVESTLAAVLRDISVASFRACHCRDYARVDLRIDRSGQPFVLEINSMAGVSMSCVYFLAATTAGYSFSNLINRILNVAHTRYFGTGIR
ncbi:D-alanine--D-alanine ligase family protein [Mesorhizobium sp. LSJC265A00]|uniref:D-alanine--D-alanine ligase family protein n=1 Tax=Mesorhizobium sp. LSJC265A00 TaxID=1287322 RepID=UPI0004CFE778|nr:ATP-grasp domain-containing protein [Mesorhizobium sp. LSJC265A00]